MLSLILREVGLGIVVIIIVYKAHAKIAVRGKGNSVLCYISHPQVPNLALLPGHSQFSLTTKCWEWPSDAMLVLTMIHISYYYQLLK